MSTPQVPARSIARGSGLVDPWFLCRWGMNLYRGCAHACTYCDGRAEKYHLEGRFEDVAVKAGTLDILARELDRVREPGFALVGGGVSDAWQPAEAECRVARGALELLLARGLPVHVLTKSALVERDLDLLAEIGQSSSAILSFSIQGTDEEVRQRFEPGAAPFAERLRLMSRARDLGLGVGAMAMPVLPGISDRPQQILDLAHALADAGAQFICFGGLTLRPGRQMEGYLELVGALYPQHLDGYRRLFREQRASGVPDRRYLARLQERSAEALEQVGLPPRAPRHLFADRMPRYSELAVLLEHVEALGGRRGLGTAGWAIQGWARQRLKDERASSWQDVDSELLALLRSGDLVNIDGIDAHALDLASQLAAPWLAEAPAQGALF